jgi:putative redox protein
VTHQFGSDLPVIEREGQALVQLAGREFTIRRSFIDDVSGQPQAARIRALRRPLLVLHAPGDKVVPIDNARHLFEAALHPKSFVSLDGADHLLTRAADAQYAAGLIAAWAARYLPEAPELPPSQAVLEHGTVRVSERGTGAFAVSIQAGRHTIVGDEPRSVGGDDAGPSPYELLLAALGECTVMTLRMYARQKQWPLGNVHVTLTHGKIHAADCADCEAKEGKVDRIERVIELIGPLDAAQRARMMEIADRCPVHRTLHAKVTVVTRSAA